MTATSVATARHFRVLDRGARTYARGRPGRSDRSVRAVRRCLPTWLGEPAGTFTLPTRAWYVLGRAW